MYDIDVLAVALLSPGVAQWACVGLSPVHKQQPLLWNDPGRALQRDKDTKIKPRAR